MKTLIESYRNRPGEHCGSAAMGNLLIHYCGLELPEDAVFGLGANLDCVYLSGDSIDPARQVFGRGISMETDIAKALQVDYREQVEPDDAAAWRQVREQVLAGRPTMLSGDIFYLDYREFTVHFTGHRFVLLGFDDASETAWIADRIRPEAEACSYRGLARSRNPGEGMTTFNLWGRFHDTAVGRSLDEAARWAISLCAQRMLAGNGSTVGMASLAPGALTLSGIAGIRHLAEDLPGWAQREDRRWLASFNARAIEKFGNGGGNFRRLYAGFLDWARAMDSALVPAGSADLARQSADAWTALSVLLRAAADSELPDSHWQEAGKRAAHIADLETTLFESLLAT